MHATSRTDRWYRRAGIALAVLALVGTIAAVPLVTAFDTSDDGSTVTEITNASGFGEDVNNYAWSMAEFEGDLYVGTARNVPNAVIAAEAPGNWTEPADPAFHPRQYRADMSGEIWRYSDGQWEQVYKDPIDDRVHMGFRTMATFDGKIYAGVGKSPINGNQVGDTPIMLASENGEDWAPVNESGLPADLNNTRAMLATEDRLYLGANANGTIGGVDSDATLYATSDPSQGWTEVASFPSSADVVSLEQFDERVYVGTSNFSSGYEVWVGPTGDPTTGAWTRVVDSGAGDSANIWAGTMEVFDGYLYVGSMSNPVAPRKGFDLVRVDAEGNWDLVVGNPPWDVRRANAVTWKRGLPISGRDAGLGNPWNVYAWSMQARDGRLYLGSFDKEIFVRNSDTAGGDLWTTTDGIDWTTLTDDGFGTAYNYGIRNMVAGETGIFAGTANPYEGQGLEVWQVDG